MFPGLMFLFTYTIHRQSEESARTDGGCAGFQEGGKNILCGQHKCVQRGGGLSYITTEAWARSVQSVAHAMRSKWSWRLYIRRTLGFLDGRS